MCCAFGQAGVGVRVPARKCRSRKWYSKWKFTIANVYEESQHVLHVQFLVFVAGAEALFSSFRGIEYRWLCNCSAIKKEIGSEFNGVVCSAWSDPKKSNGDAPWSYFRRQISKKSQLAYLRGSLKTCRCIQWVWKVRNEDAGAVASCSQCWNPTIVSIFFQLNRINRFCFVRRSRSSSECSPASRAAQPRQIRWNDGGTVRWRH